MRSGQTTGMGSRLGAWSGLLIQFLFQVVLSGLSTAWLILRPGRRPTPGLARLSFDNLDETGAAVLGCMLTLTPGSTVLDVDMERKELLIHLLDASDPSRTLSSIGRHFEGPLRILFPARGGT
jgi:multisubunit Na+/H+ antiporter MnhE subunit